MSRSGPDALLAECPRCEYDLTGLPEAHQCPECGLALDRRWQVFGGHAAERRKYAGSRLRLLRSTPFLLLLIPVCILGAQMALAAFITRSAWPLLAIPLVVGLLFALRLLARNRFIAVGSEALFIYWSPHKSQTLALVHVARAEYDLFRKSLLLRMTDGTQFRLPVNSFFWLHADEVDRCVRAINRASASAAGRASLR